MITKTYRPRKRACENCKKPYLAKSGAARYCSDTCRRAALYGYADCPVCSGHFLRRRRGQEYCGRKCYLTAMKSRNSPAGARV